MNSNNFDSWRWLWTVTTLIVFLRVADDKEVTIVRLEYELDDKRSTYIYTYICMYIYIYIYIYIYVIYNLYT